METYRVDTQRQQEIERKIHQHDQALALNSSEQCLIKVWLAIAGPTRYQLDTFIRCVIPVLYLRRSHRAHVLKEPNSLANDILTGDYYSSLFYRYLITHHELNTFKVIVVRLRDYYVKNSQQTLMTDDYSDYFKILWQADDKVSDLVTIEPILTYNDIDTYIAAVTEVMSQQFLVLTDKQNQALIRLMGSGGKKTRLKLFYHASPHLEKPSLSLVKIGAAIEGIHLASLIHDDLIDQAVLRRHTPTLHQTFNQLTALHIGNIIFTQSLSLLADIKDNKIHQLFSQLFYRMVRGELSQQTYRYSQQLSPYRYLKLVRDKTALFVEVILHTAGYLGQVESDQLRLLKRAGFAIGMAYQLKDDMLDVTAGECKLGKPTSVDQANGYRTLPVIYQDLYSSKRATKSHADDVAATQPDVDFLNVGLKRTKQLAHRYIERALGDIRQLKNPMVRYHLIYFTTALYKRTR